MIKRYLKSIKENYAENPSFIKTLVLFGFFISVVILTPILNIVLNFKPALSEFSQHIISNGSYNDFDISARVGTYYKSLISVIVLAVILFGIFHSYAKKTDFSKRSKVISLKYLYNLSVIGIFCAIANVLLVEIDISIYFLVLLTSILLFSLKSKSTFWSIEVAFWIVLLVFPFSILAYQTVLKNYNGSFVEQFTFREVLFPIRYEELIYIVILSFLTLAISLIVTTFIKNLDEVEVEKRKKLLFISAVPIALIVPTQSIIFEIFNIVNVRTGMVIGSPFLWSALIFVVAIAASFFLYFKKHKENQEHKTNVIINYYFPLFLVALGLMVAQPWRTFTPEGEFFEFANHGLSVDHFFRYGKIPILETFDAHMLSNQIFAYLYGFLNGYEPWSPFLYASLVVIFMNLIIFYLLKKYMNPYLAFAICICFPLLSTFSNNYIFSGILALTLWNVLQNGSKRNFYWFWISIIFLCLYQLDIGYSAVIAGILTYFSIKFFRKENYEWKKLLTTFGITFASFFIVFIILSLIKDINPFTRLKEFLVVAMSNQNFTFADLGNTNHGLFRILYYILPLLIISLIAWVYLKGILSKDFISMIREKKERYAALVFFLFFSFFFLFNLTRGIVRHSFMFQVSTFITGTFTLAIGSFIFIHRKKSNIPLFLAVALLFFTLVNFRAETFMNKEESSLAKAIHSASFSQQFQESQDFNGTRVTPGTDTSETNYLKSILDAVLTEEETYFDFSSTNYYHALVGRENPLYVNQTPILLNGEDAQQDALTALKNQNIKVVLMAKKENPWFTIDAIPIDFKYYLLSEYIYKNFTPLVSLGLADVFVAKNQKETFQKILSQKNLLKSNSGSVVINDFSSLNIDNLQVSAMKIQKTTDRKLKLSIEGEDPLVIGLLNELKSQIALNTNTNFVLKLKIVAEKSGSLQLFNLEGSAVNFSEENSQTFALVAGKENEIILQLKKMPKDFRLDIQGTDVTINEIGFYQNENSIESPQKMVDYDLGNIPVVWGNLANKDIFSKVKDLDAAVETSSLAVTLPNTFAKDSYYLFFEATANAVFNGKVELFDQNKKIKLAFLLKTKKGKNKYAVRLSSNFEWWNYAISSVGLNLDNSVLIHKFALISADGNKQFADVKEELTLSNITDEFWFGGVGLQLNTLLMNYSKKNLKLLQQAKQIQFSDGSKVSIKNVLKKDNYIYVEINEEVEGFKEVATYPNTIELIN